MMPFLDDHVGEFTQTCSRRVPGMGSQTQSTLNVRAHDPHQDAVDDAPRDPGLLNQAC